MTRGVLVLGVVTLAACATPARPRPVETPRVQVPPAPPSDAQRPSRGQPWLDRGRTLLAHGDLVAAATALREALRQDPDLADARAALGFALYALGDLDAAVEELRSALARQPESIPVRLTLARALVARQEWGAARIELEHVLARQPELADARFALGVVRYAQGDVAAAIDAYRRVLAADPQQADAHYHLGLLLTLAQRPTEATPEFLAAAQAGHGGAQYFAGAAFAAGRGVDRDLAAAVGWWFKAAEQGVAQAAEALAQLRLTALGRDRRVPAERQSAAQAFQDYRASLWKDFPDLARDGDEPLGATLVRRGRVSEAIPVLIREASALSEPAQRLLETLYEQGLEGQLAAHDARIQSYLQAAGAEGRRSR